MMLNRKCTKHHFKLIVFFLLGAITNINAQKRIVVGYVLDSSMYSPVKNVHVTNANTNKNADISDKGIFSLYVSPNDLIFFTADGYHFKTFRYNIMAQDTLVIYLAKLPHELADVTVTAKGYTKYQQDSLKRRSEFLSDIGNKRPSVSGANGGAGIGLNLDFFSAKEKNKRKGVKLLKTHEEEAYINYRFSPEIVTAYTGFTGDTLQQFRYLYMPDYDWLRAHTDDEAIMYYINDKMKLFYLRKENH